MKAMLVDWDSVFEGWIVGFDCMFASDTRFDVIKAWLDDRGFAAQIYPSGVLVFDSEEDAILCYLCHA